VYRRFPLFLYIQEAPLMLCAILALVAGACFVFMVVAILISLQLSDKLHRVERELERQKRIPVEGRPTLWRVK
jgi:uncharacterized integral membrane protein